MGKKILITQSNYIPWKGYFDAINQVDEFVILDDVQYTKRDWRNRNFIKTKNGLLALTIPVKTKGRFYQNINEVEIADPFWRTQHWKTIKQNYSKAPYFDVFSSLLENLYSQNFSMLSEVNYFFIEQICSILKIKTKIRWSTEFAPHQKDKNLRLISMCEKTGSNIYYSGSTAKAYINIDLFKQHKIDVKFLTFDNYPEYKQLYRGFNHNVSIIDLLLNTGEEAAKYIKSVET